MIGNMLRDLPDDLKLKWFNQWDKVFKKDNPRYQPDKFYAYVNPHSLASVAAVIEEGDEVLLRELRR
jgi:hypothetical protein